MRPHPTIFLLPLLLLSSGCTTTQQMPMACVLIGTKVTTPAATTTKGFYVEVDDPLAIIQAILASSTAKDPNEKTTVSPPNRSSIP